jgi:UDP-N-acetylglucosamine 3-dehydrogenase
MTKVAVIGAGYWGKKHVGEYLAIQGTEVVVADISADNRKACEEKFKVRTVPDYAQVLSDKSIIAVSICTPNETHYEICKEALEAGKHVLLEKPMTLVSGQARELADMAEKKRLVLSVGHIFRFNNAIVKARELVKSGELGEIYLAQLSWTNLEPIFEGRDILFDLAPHPFDIINNVLGASPDWVFSIGNTCRKKEGEEAAFVHGKVGKTLVSIDVSWVTPKKVRRLSLIGSKKSIFVDCLSQQMEEYDCATKAFRNLEMIANNTIGDELSHFLSCVASGQRSVSDARIGAEIVSTIEDCITSMREGKPIHRSRA